MKANTTFANMAKINGINKKGEVTTYMGHTEKSMGGIIDLHIASGKFISLESLLIALNQIFGVITNSHKLPQNLNDDCMTIMKILPHLQWLTRQGGYNRCAAVFGDKIAKYRQGVVAHNVAILIDEIKSNYDLKAMKQRVYELKAQHAIEFIEK